MRKTQIAVLLLFANILVAQQELEVRKLNGFNKAIVSSLILKANKVYDKTSNEENFIPPKPIDLIDELQDVNGIKDLQKKLEDIEKSRIQRFGKDIESYSLKSETAFTIIDDIISDAEKLEVLYSTIKIFSDFSKNANPTEYKAFNDNLNALKSNKFKANIELPDIEISNPYISMAYSLIGGIFSKSKKRTDAIKKMTCITDFTMDFKSDLKTIDNQITYLSASANNLKTQGQSIFGILARDIGYNLSYDEYLNDKQSIQLSKNAYFTNLLSKADDLKHDIDNSADLRKIQLNFMQVIDYIKSYEILLFQGLSYYNSFIDITRKYKDSNSLYPCIDQQETQRKFEEITKELEKVKELYEGAYTSTVSTSDKLKFYFGSSN